MRCRRCEAPPKEVRRAADLLERRHALSILYVAREGAVRFNEFQYALGPIPPGTLAARLSELADAGIFERAVVDSRPPRVEYRITSCGRELNALVSALERFGRSQFPTQEEE
jgi:DNA-binding HxlR family transcriptional regulator